MKTFISIFLLLTSITATAQVATEKWVTIPAGDIAALRQIMQEASQRDPNFRTRIDTSGTFEFTGATAGLPEINSHVFIKGHHDPITFVGAGEDFANLFMVQAGGWLQLQNVEIKDFSLGLDQYVNEFRDDQSLIINHGILELEEVQIDSLSAWSIVTRPTYGGTHLYAPIITNSVSGQLQLNQVSILDSGTGRDGGLIFNDGSAEIQNTQVYFSKDEPSRTVVNGSFMNNGYMSMKNISMFRQTKSNGRPVVASPGAETYMSNSIVSGFGPMSCDVVSLGYNLIAYPQCHFHMEGDVVSDLVGLSWRPVEVGPIGTWDHHDLQPILTHALVPFATSPAVDSIDPERCPPDHLLHYDGRSTDGNADGIAKCDMGAVELQPVGLVNGGINGVYFNPDADGHYISIIDNPYSTLVMWNSFDQDGNQYFVHGAGQLVQGRSLIADAYINVNGSTSPDGEIIPAQELHWGTLEVDMISCNEGTLAFASDFPEVGSGQVRLQRLVLV